MITSTIKGGNSAARLQRVQFAMGLSNRQMAKLLQISPRTIAAWVQSGNGAVKAEQRRRLLQLDLIVALAAKVYTQDGIRAFFAMPLAEFGNKSATDLLLEGRFNSVAGTIAADYEGPDV
jgi:hypothetical protein